MSKAKARVFVPLTKVDEEQRLVYGTITQEILDKSGEMMDYEKSKPHFEKWSNDIHEASGGLSKGNLRVMHGLTVAGKLTELEFNDNDKTIEVCSKVVDDSEWNKVLEGCYTGFSVGGKYGKKWNEVIDGNTVKKYEAIPNEVSLVDNPCVPSATFALVKADGVEEQVLFKAAEADDQQQSEEPPAEEAPAQADEDPNVNDQVVEPSNDEVVQKATQMAADAADGSTWMSHVEAAREELIKAAKPGKPKKEAEGGDEEGSEEEAKEGKADSGAEDSEADDDADDAQKADHSIANRLSQKWTCTDGTAFDKKADAEAHEATLLKTEVEPTEAEKLRQRLEKAVSDGDDEEKREELPLMEDFDRLSKVVSALSTPFENGEPKLEKGMYTVNRFSSVLSDMASLSRSIKAEGKREGDDATDSTVSADIIAAVKTLGASFIAYATNQVTELLAGMDDDVVVSYHDYYYNAATVDPENGLAKDVCAVINDLREPAQEARETLAKAFGLIVGETLETDDELSPPMQKRFDEQAEQINQLTKVATDAIDKVEELAKRLKEVEDTPLPRAPNPANVALLSGDGSFLGKAANTPEEKVAVLHDMLKTHGPDGLAMELIKASQRNPIQVMHRGQ